MDTKNKNIFNYKINDFVNHLTFFLTLFLITMVRTKERLIKKFQNPINGMPILMVVIIQNYLIIVEKGF